MLCAPSIAQSKTDVTAPVTTCPCQTTKILTTQSTTTTQKTEQSSQRPIKKTKTPFAVKHPKLHTLGRKVRKKVQATASTLAPYFEIVGGLAQILTYFKI